MAPYSFVILPKYLTYGVRSGIIDNGAQIKSMKSFSKRDFIIPSKITVRFPFFGIPHILSFLKYNLVEKFRVFSSVIIHQYRPHQ